MKKLVWCLLSASLFLKAFCGAQETPLTPYAPKDFSSLLGSVRGISDSVLAMHFKLYEGYVKNTNLLLQALQEVQKDTLAFGALKRRFGWEYDGMRLHELYFESLLSAPQKLTETDSLYKAIVRDFGSYAAWQKDIIATGLMRGIGWVILYQDPVHKRLFNVWINEHDLGHLAGGEPIFVMDVWEHAYLTQYGLDRAKYIQAFLESVNWKIVSQRFKP